MDTTASNHCILRKKDYVTTPWSGGETTELLIQPQQANFSTRQFDFRISIATIRIEESVFTPLPGIQRTLLLLEGELQLEHRNHHIAHLKPFEQDSFMGNWETHCLGSGTDLNVMTQPPFSAHLRVAQATALASNAHYIVAVCLSSICEIHSIRLAQWDCVWWKNHDLLTLNTELKQGQIAWIEITKDA
jgi:environmental stress-induced protein Ves